jgi:hypothetical protein
MAPSFDEDRLDNEGGFWSRLFGGRLKYFALAAVIVLALFYPVGMLWNHQINDDVGYETPAEFAVEGGSHAVAMAAALIDREINKTSWVANNPFPFPSSLLDNMPNFQMGLMYALSRFAIEMTDQLGRARGTGQVDPDLDKASGLLKYDGRVWVWEPTISLLPTARAESQYEAGMNSLMSYNRRLAEGQAIYDKRADNLIAFLERVAADLGGASAALDERIGAAGWGWFDREADDVFYATKGRLYGYYLIVREIGRDFEDLINERNLGVVWQQMLDSLAAASALEPLVIANGDPDSLLVPNHLAAQGFYLLRARTQIREVISILVK